MGLLYNKHGCNEVMMQSQNSYLSVKLTNIYVYIISTLNGYIELALYSQCWSHPRQLAPSTPMGPEIPQYPHMISHLPGLNSPSSFTGRLLTTMLLNKTTFSKPGIPMQRFVSHVKPSTHGHHFTTTREL